MARKRRPAGKALEYMYLRGKSLNTCIYLGTSLTICTSTENELFAMVIKTHHWISASIFWSSDGLRMADGSG